MSTAFGTGEIPLIGLPQRLLLARAHAGYNHTELAELMGVSRKTIANAEGGNKTPLAMTLRAWAYATGVDLAWLETGETPTGTNPDGGSGIVDLGIKSPKLFQLSYRGEHDDTNVVPLRRGLVAA